MFFLFLLFELVTSGLPGTSHNREGIFKNNDAVKCIKSVWTKKMKDWTTGTTTREPLLIASSDLEEKKARNL